MAELQETLQKKTRMGETCGMRMIDTVHHDKTHKCAICISLHKKNRRYTKALADYERWVVDPTKQRSTAMAKEECEELWKEIQNLEAERAARLSALGSGRGKRGSEVEKNTASDICDGSLPTRPSPVAGQSENGKSPQSNVFESSSVTEEKGDVSADSALRMLLRCCNS